MKTILSFALMALVISMVAGVQTVHADSKLDSLANLATQARLQVKIQLDKLSSVSDDVKALYDQGNQETELLISSVKQGDVDGSKQHFLAAMKIFRQITQTFSELPASSIKAVTPPPQAAPVPQFDYGNAIKRIETLVNTLKALASKNNLTVDFARVDGLIQNSKTSLANGDEATLEKSFGDLKSATIDVQNTIKDMTTQRNTDRAKSFVNSYITKIDAILAQAKELKLSDDDVAKLTKAKEELASTSDPNQIIITIKRYAIIVSISDSTNQQILAATAKLDSRLAELEPQIDDIIKPKFDSAKDIVARLKNQDASYDQIKLLRLLDSTVTEIQNYLQAKQVQTANTETEQKNPPQDNPEKSPTDSKDERKQNDAEKSQPGDSVKQERTKQKETKNQRIAADNVDTIQDKVSGKKRPSKQKD